MRLSISWPLGVAATMETMHRTPVLWLLTTHINWAFLPVKYPITQPATICPVTLLVISRPVLHPALPGVPKATDCFRISADDIHWVKPRQNCSLEYLINLGLLCRLMIGYTYKVDRLDANAWR
jgi:hypothetical protein